MADLLFPFIFFIHFLVQFANANPRIEAITRECSDYRVENGTTFLRNYWDANKQITYEIGRRRFAVGSAGDPPNKIYVMAECYGDLSADDCNICYSQCRNFIPTCIPFAGGRMFLDGCYIRAANYSFFEETVSPHDVLVCGSTLDNTNSFRSITSNVVNGLIEKTVNNDGFADSSEQTPNASVYAFANCWKTLDMDSCMSCVTNAASAILSCLPATEGRALRAGCMLRYSDYAFVNKSKGFPNMVVTFVVFVFGTTAAALLAICIGMLVGKIIYKHQNIEQNQLQGIDGESSLFKRSLRFKYSTIEKATSFFSEDNKLGQGGFGEVFKGCLADGREIAVKRLYISANNRSQEVYNEMNIISQAQHKNLVRFLGCCITSQDSFMVYEFLVNKSLNLVLFNPEKKKELDWKRRVGIIVGTAEGLDYLHRDCKVVVIHRDIKASNILLDHRFRPKIADFGLARFYSSEVAPASTAIAGTFGYMAPEYLARGELTEKVDVYSFGVVILEIVSGVQNSKFNPDESLETLVTSSWKHFHSNAVSEIIDESLEVNDMKEVKRIVQVGLLCTQEDPCARPAMKEIVQMLKHNDMHLPEPMKPPFFDDTLDNSSSNCCLGEPCHEHKPSNSSSKTCYYSIEHEIS